MRSRLPIAISWPVTTATQWRAFGELQLPAITRLELFQIRVIVAVVAKIITVVASVAHDDVRVFLGNDQVVFVIESQLRRLILVVTGITIEI